LPYSDLPEPVRKFFDAAEARDADALLALLSHSTPDAGAGDAPPQWMDGLINRIPRTLRPTRVARHGNEVAVTLPARPERDSELGSARRLTWRFALRCGQVTQFSEIEDFQPELPTSVANFIWSINVADLESLMQTFHDGALVNDQLREFWGRVAIKKWAEAAIIGDQLSMYVVSAKTQHNNTAVNVIVDGTYDKRGLPDPLEISLYFSLDDNRISQLIMLHNAGD
jgi:hypothetical protein